MTQSIFSRPARRVPGDPQLRARDEKIESLKAVAGKLAHDFNNFLVPQFGYLTLLKEELPASSTGAVYAGRIETAGRQTEKYIESILLGMRPHRQFSPSAFSFSGLLDSALDEWLAEIPSGTQIKVQRSIESGTLVGDERHWRSAIEHLLSNARYALATGGRLEVTLKRSALDGAEVQRLGLETEDVYELTVRDTGFGMPAETVTRAFEPFFSTRTQVKAPGLGLTIVHAVAQFHGGQVELQSVEDQGTTIKAWIPAHGVGGRDKLLSINAAPVAAKRKRKVLLIEDDPLINEVLRDWLGRFDFDVQIATSGQEAIKHFERKGPEWSLAIIETDLGGSRGEEIFRQLSPLNAKAAWIFLAGGRKPDFAGQKRDDPATPLVIQKPVTLRAFAEVVRRLVAETPSISG
jgi:CheY-like chemotaxis protein